MDLSVGSSSTADYVDFKAVSSAALGVLDKIVLRILRGGCRRGREWIVRNPTRNDDTPGSFKVNLHTGLWADFATGDKGGDGRGRGAGGRGADHGDGVGRSGVADGGRRGGGGGGGRQTVGRAMRYQSRSNSNSRGESIAKRSLRPLPCSMCSSMRSESMSDTFSATTSETRNPAP
jgi:hypothetical protein